MTSIQKTIYESEQISKEYAKAEAKKTYIQEFKKSKKAILMKQFQLKGFTTIAAQEREAMAHPEYLELLKAEQAVVELATKYKNKIRQPTIAASSSSA